MGYWTNDEILVAIRITDPDTDTDPDPDRDTGKSCLGGGMHFPSASSYFGIILLPTTLVVQVEQSVRCVSVRMSVCPDN